MNLAAMFPATKGFASHSNAARKLKSALDQLSDDDKNTFHWVIVERASDNRFLPIVILRHNCTVSPGWFIHNFPGICVTN